MSGEPRGTAAERLLAVAVWTVLLAGAWLWGRELTDGEPVGGTAPSARTAPADAPTAGGTAQRPETARDASWPPPRNPLEAAAPWQVDVAAAGVRARVVERGLTAGGAVDPPREDARDTVGWYGGGPSPGEEGAAVLVGHLDTPGAEAVFHRLGAVRAGARIDVHRVDGTVAEFTVEEAAVLSQLTFDPHAAYGSRVEGRAELHLITCAGDFDRASGNYTANLVVSAYLTGVRPDPGPAG